MSPDASLATDILVAAALAMDVIIVILSIGLIFFRGALISFFDTWNICTRCVSALVALSAFFGSMIYSTVTGFAGCPLCLTSRAIMATLMLVLPLAMFSRVKETVVLGAGKILAGLGIVVSGYHYTLQWLSLTGTHLPCPAIEGLPSCDRVYFIEFGFVTIPFVALSAFTLIFLLLVLAGQKKGSFTQPLS